MEVKQKKKDIILDDLDFIYKLYDIARIVDPVKNTVLNYQDDEVLPEGSICYNFWKRDNTCQNCISKRALEENDTFAKIEYRDDTVYMVLAIPLEYNNKKIVLELLKDITEERILFDSVDDSKSKAYSLLNNRKDNIIKDCVTKIFNNRYINERLPYDIMKRHIEEEYLSLLMINIDDFKEINYKYGYDFGNQILGEFATILSTPMNKKDKWVARYTDNTFMIILNKYSLNQAKEWAEKLKRTIEGHRFYCEEEPITLTSSMGIYTQKTPDISMEDFIEKTETLLKAAKEKGKNCIISLEKRND